MTSVLLAVLLSLSPGSPVRVACLGDSITFGAQMPDRAHSAYPVQLGHRLGPGFEVRNFGVGGCTLLRGGDRPYVDQSAWREALAWAPDVALVMLGTNDTCLNERRRNWALADDLEASAVTMVEALRAANGGVRVVFLGPPPMFFDKPGLDADRRENLSVRAPRLERIGAALRAVAAAHAGVEYHDLARGLSVGQVTDGVHTTPFGAEAIAERCAEVVRTPAQPSLDLGPALRARGLTPDRSRFFGFERFDFGLADGRGRCVIVAPHVVRSGAPWIWRARFFGHEPALDLDLLDRGFHLGYCDVANLYGTRAAMARWDAFYRLARDLGLHPRAVLEGMSRGGLPILAFAAAYPERVAAVYGDNPVVDPRSWPGGRSGKRSDADWARYLAVAGLTPEEAWAKAPSFASLAGAARAGVPLLLVLGAADDVVPPAENGDPLAAAYAALGGVVQVWRKPGAGHHPHGLHPPGPLRRAILNAYGIDTNPAVRSVPSAEHRGHPAGWGGGTWWDQLERLRGAAFARPPVSVVFLGDSITQSLSGAHDRQAREGGPRVFDRYHGRRHAVSLGLSGDRTEHLLFRIEHGALATLDPRVIVLQIGVNNVNSGGHTAEETAAGIAAVVARLREREPQATVLLCGPFPLGAIGEPRRAAVDRVHTLIAPLAAQSAVEYIDLRPLFVDEAGRTNERMRNDRVHITEAGYAAWMEAIEPHVARLLAP